jgi:hypothetical protein
VRRITSRFASAIGAAMILAASPMGARAQQPVPQPRAEAQWMGRRAAARTMVRWRISHRRMAVAWRRGYARGFAVGRYPLRSMAWRGVSGRGFARTRLYGRFWEGRRLGRRSGRRWEL